MKQEVFDPAVNALHPTCESMPTLDAASALGREQVQAILSEVMRRTTDEWGRQTGEGDQVAEDNYERNIHNFEQLQQKLQDYINRLKGHAGNCSGTTCYGN